MLRPGDLRCADLAAQTHWRYSISSRFSSSLHAFSLSCFFRSSAVRNWNSSSCKPRNWFPSLRRVSHSSSFIACRQDLHRALGGMKQRGEGGFAVKCGMA